MAKVSLRIYNREIETMVDRGQLDEAIAHCRHILNIFPKNLETYRLLGKAYLEARHYNEATDIFRRVLMAVPDDFVAHVGMSIISDEQNEMDAAIWHMERAFEVQPSNAAIQSELQRLFGRRDGVEPPKIRLTRGALAHMYLQGELYPQAIAEIKAVLDEDRERQDMQVLLARAYYHAGRKGEAADMCAQLLKRYPYCLEANRVLVELLPESERGESPQVYRNRLNELDPYAAFTTGSVFHTEEVPDAAVSLERLEWDGEPVNLGPDWKESQGIGLAGPETDEGEQPDWLKAGLASGTFGATSAAEEPTSVSGGDNDIPDFLRDAGWGKDSGTFKEGPGSFNASDEASEEPELAEGDLPDWIKAMAPSATDLAASTPQDQEDLTQDDVPDWLQGIGNAQESSMEEQPLEKGDVPDWLAAMKPESQLEDEPMAEPASNEDLPDWLAAMKPKAAETQEPQPMEDSTAAQPASEEDLPDWLADLKREEAMGQEPVSEEAPAEPAGDEDLPDWIASLKQDEAPLQESQLEEQPVAELAQDEDLPDWLAEMKDEGALPQPEQLEEVIEPTREEDLPDWIASLKQDEAPLQESQPEEQPAAELAQEEDIPDWLMAMKDEEVVPQQEQSAEEVAEPAGEEDLPDWIAALKPAEPPLQQEQPEEMQAEPAGDDDLPDWLRAVQVEDDMKAAQQITDETPGEPVQEFPEITNEALSDWQIGDEETSGAVAFDTTDTGTLGTSAAEQDDAIAWLESLASKHGAKPEELVTDPNARKETAPDWVQQARAVKEQQPVEPSAAQEEPQAESASELPEFMAEEKVEPVQPSDEEIKSTEAAAPSVPSAQEQDDAIAWLESLAAKHGAKPEELVTDPNARKETAPEWVQKSAEVDNTVQSPVEPEAAPEAVEEPLESVPDWLEHSSEEEVATPEAELEDTQPGKPVSRTSMDETGMWLRSLDESEQTVEQEPAEETGAPELAGDDGIPDWLRELEGEPAKAEAGLSSGEEPQEVPDWLSEVKAEPPVVETGSEPEEIEQDVPDWLRGVEVEPSAVEGPAESMAEEETPTSEQEPDAVPDWLTGVEPEMPAPSEEVAEEETGMVTGQEEGFRPVEAAAESTEPDFTDWLKGLDPKDAREEATEAPAEESAAEDLPAWLAGLDEEPAQQEPAVSRDDDLPEWLRGVDEKEPVHAEPTTPSDWRPVDVETPAREESVEEFAQEPEPVMEEPSVEAAPPTSVEPVAEQEPEPETPPERERYVEPVTRSRTGMTGMLSSSQDPVLAQAQLELTRGNIKSALSGYEKLIKKGKMLDEIIFDLREAQYRFPVDVSIMQALGDAYMRANRLQDALDAYTKAEELLR